MSSDVHVCAVCCCVPFPFHRRTGGTHHMAEPGLQAQLAAAALVCAALALGWFAIWKLVLLRIPMIRGMCDLPPLDAKKSK